MTGRKGITVAEESRWVFNRLAQDYRARPPYPAPLLDRLAALAGGAGATVVDLGAGTGLVALPLAERGLRVFAVEPARAMLEVLRDAAIGAVHPVHAAAESTGLAAGCADLAVVADALHWMDPERAAREIVRIVRRRGAVAIVEPAFADTPFMRSIAALIEAANFKARPQRAGARRVQLLRACGVAESCAEQFQAAERLDPDRLDAVLRSLSLVGPALGPPALARLLEEVRAAAALHGAVWSRDITLAWGRIR